MKNRRPSRLKSSRRIDRSSVNLHRAPVERLELTIVTPEGRFLKETVDMVELPADDGEIGVFPGHLPVIAVLGTGEVRLYRGDNVERLAVSGGFVQITAHHVRMLTSFAGRSDETDIEAACERARRALEDIDELTPEEAAAETAMLRSALAALSRRRGR